MGTGDLQADLIAQGYEVWGIDASAHMLKQARSKARRVGLPAPRMLRARAQLLPFPASYFNSVVSTFPSEYIADPQTLAELARVLVQGGRLVIVPGGWLKPRDARARALEGVAMVVYGYDARPDASDTETIRRKLAEGGGWIVLLRQRMEEAEFQVSARIASNSKGSCLIVIGIRPAPSKESDLLMEFP
jgi:SAM-dependent methyltransferase